MKNVKTFKNFIAGFILGISLLAFGTYAAGTTGGTIGSLFGYNTGTSKYYLKGENIETSGVTTTQIKNGTILSEDIADGTITSSDFDSSVMDEITTSKIYDKDDTSYYVNPNNLSNINYLSSNLLYLNNSDAISCEDDGYLTTNSLGKVYCKTNEKIPVYNCSGSLSLTDTVNKPSNMWGYTEDTIYNYIPWCDDCGSSNPKISSCEDRQGMRNDGRNERNEYEVSGSKYVDGNWTKKSYYRRHQNEKNKGCGCKRCIMEYEKVERNGDTTCSYIGDLY